MINFVKAFFWYLDCFTLYGGGKGGAAPPAPDYVGAANTQSAASKEIANAQTFANRPTLNTPWGQMAWSAGAGVDPSTGQPVTQWTGNLNLTPEEQASLSAQQRVTQGRSDAAEGLLGQATGAFNQAFDWENLPDAPGNIGDAQKDAYKLMSEMQEPGRTQQRAGLDTRLANMGFGLNAEGANRARAGLADQFAQQDKSMMAQSLGEGRAQAAAQATLRQQGIAEEAQRRGMPLNELNALLTGQQVNTPNMPSFMGASAGQAPNLLGAAEAQGNYGLGAAKLDQASQPNWGSLVGTAAGIALAPYTGGASVAASDVRLKSNITRVGTHPRGVGIYEYTIDGHEEVGVLAQELLEVAPELVVMMPNGYLAVDYGGL